MRHESTIRADERDRCRREAFKPNGSCPCCGRQDASDYERALRSKEEQIQRLLRAAPVAAPSRAEADDE